MTEAARGREAAADRGPHTALTEAAADQGRLVVPDLETAIIQLYALPVFPHTVFGTRVLRPGTTARAPRREPGQPRHESRSTTP
ncbi:hypothetical protein [Streptomyces sp. P17]|uniref:hypothetical protein n=1 Tax=Streptomyces sp. P17 TaxID=3074716 RepID=UPI0028F4564E|nr:hypothetical protein [Streptomyces sp. P17]MDT9695155.1 hypothetical protein [Streptomyces sp. P17]